MCKNTKIQPKKLKHSIDQEKTTQKFKPGEKKE